MHLLYPSSGGPVRKVHIVQSRYRDPDKMIERLRKQLEDQGRLVNLYEKRYDLVAPRLRKEAEA